MSNNQSTLSINTPASLTQCANTTIVWNGGVEPFYIGYVASATIQTTATPSPAVAFRTNESSQEWLCNVAAGMEITLTVRDSAGAMAYSSPLEVQNSTDITCLPGYVPSPSSSPSASNPPSSSSRGLSKGAIGGIAAGAVVAAIITGTMIFLFWRQRRRRRDSDSVGSDTTEKAGDGEGDGRAEPKVEPYLGTGGVDLADEVDYGSGTATPTPTPFPPWEEGGTTTTVSGPRPVRELERQTKQMLGVQTSSSVTTDPSRSAASPIPSKSAPRPGPSRTSPEETGQTLPTTHAAVPSPTLTQTRGAESATRPDQRETSADQETEIEYVRHTDGGGVRVELPPLYTDVPARHTEQQ